MKNRLTNIESVLYVFLLSLITYSLISAFYQNWEFTTDDAYISWHYAENLINGHGLRWYPANNPVEGYSNFFWVILAAFILKAGLPLVITVKIIAISCLFLAFFSLYLIARKFLPPLLSLLPVYLFSHYIGVIWWALSGLETSLYIALATLLTWQILNAFNTNKINYQAWWAACILLTLLSFTRFEGLVWSGIVFIFLSCLIYQKRIAPIEQRKILFIAVFGFILPYCCYFFWRYFYFGHLLPNSYRCKVSQDSYQFYLIKNYLLIAFPCLILSLPYLLNDKNCRTVLFWLPSLVYCVLLWSANPVVAHFNRLFLAPFGLLSFLAVMGVYQFLGYFSLTNTYKALICTSIIIIFTYFFIPGAGTDTALELAHYQQRVTIRKDVVSLLNQQAAPIDRVLLGDCGLIPFLARKDIEFIDSQCLNNLDLSNSPINFSTVNYANYLQQVVKPDWVIAYFMDNKRDNQDILFNTLKNNNFFENYELITSFSSHQFIWESTQIKQDKIDFTYQIYQCKPSYCIKGI